MAFCRRCGIQVDPRFYQCPSCGEVQFPAQQPAGIPQQVNLVKTGSAGRAIGGALLLVLGIVLMIGGVFIPVIAGIGGIGAMSSVYLTGTCCGLGVLMAIIGIAFWHTSR